MRPSSTAHFANGAAASPAARPGHTAVLKDIYPVRWAGRQAVVSLDETIREVRGTAFTARGHETAPGTSLRDGTA